MNITNYLLNRSSQFKYSIVTDSIQILALYFFSVLVVYKLPTVAGYIFFALLTVQFYRSKKDYFWLAFFFVITTGPGGFFYVTDEVMTGQLPIFSLGGGINISITEVFLAIAILKALTRGRKQQILLSKPLKMILFYSLFMFMVSMLVFDATLIRVLKDLRYFFYYFSIFPIYYLVYKEGDGERLIYNLFPFVFVSFFAALYFVFAGDYLIHLLAPGLMKEIYLGIGTGTARYSTSGGGGLLVLLLCYFVALFLVFKEGRSGRLNFYLVFVAGICYITMLLTATRVWFVVFSFTFLIAVIFLHKNLKLVGGVLLIVILFSIPYLFVPKLRSFVDRSWTRIESVFEINKEGSMAFEAVEYKKKVRLIDTLAGIKKSPVIGWGVSDQFYEYTRGGDIGNFNLVLRVGIIGFAIYAYLWVRFFSLIRSVDRRLSPINPYHKQLFFFSISLVSLLIAHFTTHQIFAMLTSKGNSIFLIFYLFFPEYFSKDALKLEYLTKKFTKERKNI